MTTLQMLLNAISAKPEFIRITEKSKTVLTGSTDTQIVYDLFYINDGAVRQAKIVIYVIAIGTGYEEAYYRNAPPDIVSNISDFEVRLLAAMNAATTGLIKRIVIDECYPDRTCAVIKVYTADAVNPTKITMSKRFVYDDAGTLKHYPYLTA